MDKYCQELESPNATTKVAQPFGTTNSKRVEAHMNHIITFVEEASHVEGESVAVTLTPHEINQHVNFIIVMSML